MDVAAQERQLLALDRPVPVVDPLDRREVPQLVERLRRMLGDDPPANPAEARERLRARLTRTGPGVLPEEAWPLLDTLWATEASQRPVTIAADLPRIASSGWGARVSHWRGDLTTLRVGAIANAANEGLTGCYQPFHPCVDNAIHTAAGPRLREDCGKVMAARGRPEPTATATATRGWFLPARYVLHTVGPIVRGGAPGPEDEAALARCYRECLDRAAGLEGCRSVAFCSISTGLFGYPITLAAPVVLRAVRAWLQRTGGEERSSRNRPQDPAINPEGVSQCEPGNSFPGGLEQVVLVTYSAKDAAIYETAIQEALRE